MTVFLDWWKGEKVCLDGPVPNERRADERARRLYGGVGQLTPVDPMVICRLDQGLA